MDGNAVFAVRQPVTPMYTVVTANKVDAVAAKPVLGEVACV